MATDPLQERKRLTFEQAEGAEPLPTQLKLKELSPALRAAAWKLVLKSIEQSTHSGAFGAYIADPWKQILEDRHVYRLHRPVDEFTNELGDVTNGLKPVFMAGDYTAVLGILQDVIRHPTCPHQFADRVEGVLKFARAAYRVLDRTIVPIGSDAERETLERAFADLASSEFHGARKHLRSAAEQLTAGHNADSIRESIHAVESVVRVLEPKGDFARALARLDAKVNIHGAMRAGFGSLYGFTSNEKGIRHPLLEVPAANVDETDALFMIGACAAFVSYLINKARAAGLLAGKN
jgi:hypothetical protein